MDLVWKPFNFVRQHGFEVMQNRCNHNPDPFAYCHFENINILTTKTGLIKTLKNYYSSKDEFKKVGYTYEHSMAMSFVIPANEFLDSQDLHLMRRNCLKYEQKNFTDEKLSVR